MTGKVPYETILACREGNDEALYSVVEHYAPLIAAASQKTILNKDGQKTVIVDEVIKNYIEEQLMLQIYLKYDEKRMPRKRRYTKYAKITV